MDLNKQRATNYKHLQTIREHFQNAKISPDYAASQVLEYFKIGHKKVDIIQIISDFNFNVYVAAPKKKEIVATLTVSDIITQHIDVAGVISISPDLPQEMARYIMARILGEIIYNPDYGKFDTFTVELRNEVVDDDISRFALGLLVPDKIIKGMPAEEASEVSTEYCVPTKLIALEM